MQDITPILKDGSKVIETYGSGSFTVNSKKHTCSIVIMPLSLKEISAKDISEISLKDIEILISQKNNIEFVLVGFGNQSDFLPVAVEKKLAEEKIKVEYMNTGSACRTYNVLMGEDRKIAAILIAI